MWTHWENKKITSHIGTKHKWWSTLGTGADVVIVRRSRLSTYKSRRCFASSAWIHLTTISHWKMSLFSRYRKTGKGQRLPCRARSYQLTTEIFGNFLKDNICKVKKIKLIKIFAKTIEDFGFNYVVCSISNIELVILTENHWIWNWIYQ